MNMRIATDKLLGAWSGNYRLWVDSFHTMCGFMQFEGQQTADGSVEGNTTWSAGEGPAWGWRIVVSNPGPDELLVRMYIATPTGEEAPAVESRYLRVPTYQQAGGDT